MSKKSQGDEREGSLRNTIIAVLLLILLLAFGFFMFRRYRDYLTKWDADKFTVSQTSENIDDRPANPIDFPALWQENGEVYAWISIPNTDIEQPILQSFINDLYYLDRDIHGKKSKLGAIFTQSHNRLDFSDPVTVIYGHHYKSGGMFSNLHYFEDKAFFDDNEFFYIYLPGRRLTYQIVSAFKYDDRHILNTFDFSRPEVLESFHKTVKEPLSLLKNVRESAELSPGDRLVVLSTCLLNGGNGRYLVNGVLMNDERTK
ncbi:MAG: class B sortase [Oscillospiraceae bacterium]|nr:class B sortase [Oscillospiraceae bacterium]